MAASARSQDDDYRAEIYRITNIANGRVYIGVSKDSIAQFKQHQYNPPSRMKEDVDTYRPFRSYFYYEVLEGDQPRGGNA